MLHVVLYQPEIPPNTGNVIRLCANTGASLHLVYPLGFEWDDTRVKRAGLDYHELAHVRHHASWAACREALSDAWDQQRFFVVENPAPTRYDVPTFRDGDVFVFGQETKGLPQSVQNEFTNGCRLQLPMLPDNRSLNLSNAVAVMVFEAWRQMGFSGAATL